MILFTLGLIIGLLAGASAAFIAMALLTPAPKPPIEITTPETPDDI